MGKTDPRVDQYIAKSAGFAKPILLHLRKVVHAACPDVEETMKWSAPHFDYKGMMCGMSAFKSHCAFGFWKSSLVLDSPGSRDAMGHFGRITSVRDLPSDRVLTGYIKKAAKLNDAGVKVARKPPQPKKPLSLLATLRRRSRRKPPRGRPSTPSAQATIVNTSVDHRSQDRRHAPEANGHRGRMARQGKRRNWKYQPK